MVHVQNLFPSSKRPMARNLSAGPSATRFTWEASRALGNQPGKCGATECNLRGIHGIISKTKHRFPKIITWVGWISQLPFASYLSVTEDPGCTSASAEIFCWTALHEPSCPALDLNCKL